MRYFLQLAYRGTKYHGWQRQPNGISVQEVLESALATVLRQPISIVGSGRTDAGVHAGQQFAHFEFDAPLTGYLIRSLNSLLPPDIAVYECFPVRADDHARFTATSRYYQYQISRRKDPFRDGLVYVFTLPLDVKAMNEAAATLLNHADFESFSKVKTDVKTFNCQIELAYWEEKPTGDLVFHIKANRFLHGMVRAIVGTLLAVGQGRISSSEFEQIILARDRRRAGRAAPAEGLSLMEVGYPEEVFKKRKNE
ncbi:tRNA pseudouridine(38-40) synthase TruA [Spirosoma sp. KCTC 42546]|uniref:tRNA pseudouridine(38-40) synthase TruA n=1 Tax=Spirosoma sp. KCTC 42546 TaxID=2520506 RepID=UPI001159CB59|nr:tRNA pseudouridine(38-40) synthase TruA [Spirosoma sp. KCTC 42546]QDK80391.1 tRNA pseudouridine(38-40) synthase TruA [Spirosoma sp. KCTC 42546]